MDATADTIAEIERLGQLEPDWDSYGADPIDPDALTGARSFVQHINHVARTLGVDLIPPDVGPTPDSGVALIWPERGRGEVEVRFSPRGNRVVVVRERTKVALLSPFDPLDLGFQKSLVDRYLRP